MKLTSALDEFELLQRRRHRGEEGRRTALALAALREFLLDHAGLEDTEAIRPRDLYEFLLEYYPEQEEPEPDVAAALLEASEGLALWLIEREERTLAPFAAAAERLREDVPRTLAARAALHEHARRDDLRAEVDVDAEEEGGNGATPVGSVTGGLDRLARLDQIDYASAETDYFTVQSVAADSVVLQSPAREALGEAPVTLRVPAAASERLRPGDMLHAEVAPGPETWEVLDVFGVRPGGYA